MPISPKLEWKIKNRIINLIVENNGEIFGGTARDKYLHDTHASLIYKYIAETSNNPIVEFNDKYNDKEYRPDLFGRWTIVHDIDACIHVSNYDKLVEALQAEYPSCHKIFSRDPKQYFPNLLIDEGQVRHERFRIDIVNSGGIFSLLNSQMMNRVKYDMPDLSESINSLFASIRTINYIWIDLMVILAPSFLFTIEPPFGNPDFECNSLIMNKDGFRVSSHLLIENSIYPNDIVGKANLLTKIMGDILKKDAVLVYNYNYPWYRISKMKKKEWNIPNLFKHIDIVKDENYDGYCIICNDTISTEMYKFKCCDARYHRDCMLQAFEKGISSILDCKKCIMCKEPLRNINRDYRILKNV